MEAVRDGAEWMLRLAEGERLPDALADWATREGIRAAAVLTGIGLVRDTSIGYLRGDRYDVGEFPEPMELLHLGGSIAVEEGAPSVHLHLTAGRPDHSTVGGHLVSSTVALLAEVPVRTFPGRTFRRPYLAGRPIRALRLDGPTTDGPR